jgi:hypothetical protein
MKKCVLTGLMLASVLGGCSLINGHKALCDSPDTKQLAQELLNKTLNDTSISALKGLISEGGNSIDVSRLRAAIGQIKFDLADVRTSRSDPQSSKQFCAAAMTASLPASLVNDANATRTLRGEPNIAEGAVLSDLKLEGNTLSHDLEYSVQPTDDGKKIYAEIQNADLPMAFLSQVVMDALQKNTIQAQQVANQRIAMENQQLAAEQEAEAAQEAATQAAQQQADQSAYAQIQQDEAQSKLNTANQKLNIIWNSASKAARNQLLADQRLWLKKRDLECRLNSADAAADQQALVQIRCQTTVTEQRIPVLQQMIEQTEANLPAPAVAQQRQPPAAHSSDDVTRRVAEENAARMAANLQNLERKLSNF